MKTLALLITFMFVQISSAGEVVEQIFNSGGRSFKVEFMDSFPYPPRTVEQSQLLLITHNSQYWDNQRLTWSGTEKLVQYFAGKNLPYLYMADLQDRSQKLTANYFPKGVTADNLYPFQGDSHRIVMRGSDVVIAGGNFTICACQTARSVIALSETKGILNVHYAMDAIYEGQLGFQLTLAQISEKLSDDAFINYLKMDYFNQDTLPCVESMLQALDRKFNYEIYRNNKLVGNIGNEGQVVRLNFSSSRNVVELLKLKSN